MESGKENCDDWNEVINEFSFCGYFFSIENHDSPITGLSELFDELKTESTYSVSVGNHNFWAIASVDFV